jgi:fermentation-respiration switch protein FrsA (DUF1100 family)
MNPVAHAARPAGSAAPYDPTVPPAAPHAYVLGDVTRLDVSFPSDGFMLFGHVYLPPGGPGGRDHRAIVLDGPAPSIKELVVPAYAIRLAKAGYLVLTFDRRGWGGSEGRVRQQMNPPDNVRDIRNATTYLLSRDDVDRGRVAAVGICTAAGFMLQVGALDRRYRAVACLGGAYGALRVLRDSVGHDGWVQQMRALAEERLADLEAGEPNAHQALQRTSDPPGTGLVTLDEAYDYYTSRQPELAPRWQNRMTRESMENLLAFDAVPYAALVAPTPLLVVHGTVDPATPPRYAQEVYDTAVKPKSLVWVETTNHVQIYDVEPYVGQAVSALTGWLDEQMPPT